MRLLLLLIIIMGIVQIASATTEVTISNDTNFSLDNSANITIKAYPEQQNFTNTTDPAIIVYDSLSNPTSTLELWMNDTRIRFQTATNKTIRGLYYNNVTDNLTFIGDGVDGYLNITMLTKTASGNYTLRVNSTEYAYNISGTDKIIWYNYSWVGTASTHFGINPTSVSGYPNITAQFNNINGWNQTAMSVQVGNTVTFNVTSNQTPNNVEWKVAGTIEQNTSNLEFIRAFNSVGVYNVTAQVNNSNGASYVAYTVVTVTTPGGGGGGTTYYRIQGWVFDGVGNPIDGASVWTNKTTFTTNVNGKYGPSDYLFVNGNYWVNITKTGYTANNTSVLINADLVTFNGTLIFVSNPNITSWSNSNTSNQTLSLWVAQYTNITFNATANQTLTGCTWTGSTQINCSGTDTFAFNNFSSPGVKTVSITGSNANGSTQTITWTITVSGVTGLSLYGYVYNTLSVPIQNARVDFNNTYTLTNSSGGYNFTGVTADTYTVLVRAIGYRNSSNTSAINSDTLMNFTLHEKTAGTVMTPGFEGILAGIVILIVMIRKKRKVDTDN